jgi:hypothetical protein
MGCLSRSEESLPQLRGQGSERGAGSAGPSARRFASSRRREPLAADPQAPLNTLGERQVKISPTASTMPFVERRLEPMRGGAASPIMHNGCCASGPRAFMSWIGLSIEAAPVWQALLSQPLNPWRPHLPDSGNELVIRRTGRNGSPSANCPECAQSSGGLNFNDGRATRASWKLGVKALSSGSFERALRKPLSQITLHPSIQRHFLLEGDSTTKQVLRRRISLSRGV